MNKFWYIYIAEYIWKMKRNSEMYKKQEMPESQNHAKWKKLDTRVHTLWFHLHKTLEETNLIYSDRK